MLNDARLLLTDLADAELTIQAKPDEVRRASLWLERIGMARGLPENQLARLDLCLNEVLVNILSHAGADAQVAPIYLQFNICRQSGVSLAALTVSDAGSKFNPLMVVVKQRPQNLAEAEPGGLGLSMLHKFTDQLSYDYRAGRNHLTFSVRWLDTP